MIAMAFNPKPDPGGLLRHVPVRLLLVVLVMVPWSGLAYRTVDRIDHDHGELTFTEYLAPAAVRVKLLAQVQRELQFENDTTALRNAGANTTPRGRVPFDEDLIEHQRKVTKAISRLEIYGRPGATQRDLKRIRDQVDSATTSDDLDNGYDDLLAQNREELDASMRELWVLVAMLGGDDAMRNDLRALELSLKATDASIRESSLILRLPLTTSSDQTVASLIEAEQRSALRALEAIAALPVTVASPAKEVIKSTDEKDIASATSRVASLEEPRLTSEDTNRLYSLLVRRNARLGSISDDASTALSQRAQRLLSEERMRISRFIWWLVASLVVSLSIAALVGRAIWRPIHQLGKQAAALVNGIDSVQPIVPRGPRELVSSAHALNDLTEALTAVQKQADALATGPLDEATHHVAPPGQLGSSVQLAVRRLSESIQLNNQLRDEFEYAANHDTLTGLPNRAAVYRLLEQLVQANDAVALLFIDLDHFKRVNDAEGHLAGDEILRVMATRFTACAGPNRMVARLGGDEFLVVCSDESLEGAAVLVDLIRTAASEPIDLGHTTVRLGASAGVAFAELGDTCSSLLKRADQALYAAKAARRTQHIPVVEPFVAPGATNGSATEE